MSGERAVLCVWDGAVREKPLDDCWLSVCGRDEQACGFLKLEPGCINCKDSIDSSGEDGGMSATGYLTIHPYLISPLGAVPLELPLVHLSREVVMNGGVMVSRNPLDLTDLSVPCGPKEDHPPCRRRRLVVSHALPLPYLSQFMLTDTKAERTLRWPRFR